MNTATEPRGASDQPEPGAGLNAALGAAAAAAYAGFLAFAFLQGGKAAPDRIEVVAPEGRPTVPGPAIAPGPDAVQPEAVPPEAAPGEALVTPESFSQPASAAPDSVMKESINPHLEFIVKFDEAQGQEWVRRFTDDPKAAREAFLAAARSQPGFRDLALRRMTASGTATLVFDGALPPTPAERDALSAEILKRLNAAPGVKYAEPNLVGWRGQASP